MKPISYLLILWFLFLTSCSPHIHLDFLVKEQIEEVILLKSKAKEKVQLLDIEGMIGFSANPGLLEKGNSVLSRVS